MDARGSDGSGDLMEVGVWWWRGSDGCGKLVVAGI